MNNTSEDVKLIHRYSDGLKRKIVEEIEGGELTISEAMDLYDIKHLSHSAPGVGMAHIWIGLTAKSVL